MNGSLKDRIQQVERLVAQIQSVADPDAQGAALELIQTVMDFHATAIDRMMEITAGTGDAGWRIIDKFAGDEIVAHLLLMHGLHPLDLETRVRDALEKVRPYLLSHGGNVEFIDIAGGVVQLRLVGSCNGCPSSSLTLKGVIETAIHETAPDVVSIECSIGDIDGTRSTSSLLSAPEAAPTGYGTRH